MRYYIGVDWADASDAVWVEDEHATKILSRSFAHTVDGFTDWGRWLDEQRAAGVELWAAIEKPDGRGVDFLLDHDRCRSRGLRHHHAIRALGAKWLKILFVLWTRQVPYDETHHLAMMARQLRQAA
jgi:hypothetical protein